MTWQDAQHRDTVIALQAGRPHAPFVVKDPGVTVIHTRTLRTHRRIPPQVVAEEVGAVEVGQVEA